MSEPTAPVDVPDAVVRIAGGRDCRAVWRNRLGGVTFVVGTGADREFVKWAPPSVGSELAVEARRLAWATPFTSVPRVLATGHDAAGSWLHTLGLIGENAVSPRWRAEPWTASRAIGHGLRLLHDALPVSQCPFDWGITGRLSARAAERGRPAEELHIELGPPPPVDRLVVCHGDACAPNTLLTDDGVVSGHVDLGSLGVADRWAALAVASWSTVWNYGPGYEVPLLTAYGVEPDPVRIAYYRRLWGEPGSPQWGAHSTR